MKKIVIVFTAIAAFAAFVAWLAMPSNKDSQQSTSQTQTQSETASTKLTAIKADLKAGALLIDVRTDQEYIAGHATGAINLALDAIQEGTYPSKDKDKVIYLYCHSGNRAGQAKQLLEKAGFTQVTSLGGLSDWQAMGGTTETGQPLCTKNADGKCS